MIEGRLKVFFKNNNNKNLMENVNSFGLNFCLLIPNSDDYHIHWCTGKASHSRDK